MINITNIRFIIGTGKTKDGNLIHPATRDAVLDQVRRHCARAFGGWTETIGRGGWYDDKRKELVVESCAVFDCAVIDPTFIGTQDYDDAIEAIVDVAKEHLAQDCILVQKFYGESHLA